MDDEQNFYVPTAEELLVMEESIARANSLPYEAEVQALAIDHDRASSGAASKAKARRPLNSKNYDRDQTIIGLIWEGSMTLCDIGALYGITRARVQQISAKAGVVNQRMVIARQHKAFLNEVRLKNQTEKQERRAKEAADIIALRVSGMSFKQISTALYGSEVQWNDVQRTLTAHGVTTSRESIRQRDIHISLLRKSGKSVKEIMEETGLEYSNLSRILRRQSKAETEGTS